MAAACINYERMARIQLTVDAAVATATENAGEQRASLDACQANMTAFEGHANTVRSAGVPPPNGAHSLRTCADAIAACTRRRRRRRRRRATGCSKIQCNLRACMRASVCLCVCACICVMFRQRARKAKQLLCPQVCTQNCAVCVCVFRHST